MMNKFKLLLTIAILGLVWFVPVQAQEENEGVATLVMITPKAGHEKTLIKAITDYHHWVANFEGHMKYRWYRILTGPHTGKFVARSGNHNWADFDAKYDWEEEAGEVFRTNVLPNIEKMERSMTQEMSEYSYWPENFDGYSHYTVTEWYVLNGKFGQFRRGLKRIVDALKAGGFPNHFGFHSLESGGYASQISLVSPTKGWAGFSDADPSFRDIMMKELGGAEEFEAFMSDWGSTFKSGHRRTVEFMPEASDYGK